MALVRKAVKHIPNDVRHHLGLSIPHDARLAFYLRKFVEAESVYAPKCYQGAVTLFTRKGASEWHRASWSKLAGSGLTIHELPVARHLEIIRAPNSRFLAMQIDACLNALGSSELPARAQATRLQ